MADTVEARLDGQLAILVEDDLLVGMGLKSSLEQLGATVTWHSDVAGALAALDGTTRYDVAVLDINLGGEPSAPVLDRLADLGVYTVVSTGYDPGVLEPRFQHLARCQKPFTRSKMRQLLCRRG